MFKVRITLALVAGIMTLFLLLAGCSARSNGPEAASPSAAQPSLTPVQPTNGSVQSSQGGAVTIDAELVGTSVNSLSVRVVMNTHSVALDRYDLKKLAELRDDSGNRFQPTGWDAPAGGHHRQGSLTFPIPDSLRQGNATYLELVIRDVAGVKERVLRWEL